MGSCMPIGAHQPALPWLSGCEDMKGLTGPVWASVLNVSGEVCQRAEVAAFEDSLSVMDRMKSLLFSNNLLSRWFYWSMKSASAELWQSDAI